MRVFVGVVTAGIALSCGGVVRDNPNAPTHVTAAPVEIAVTVSTLAGSGAQGYADGPAAAAMFYDPSGVAIDGVGNILVAEQGNNTIRSISPSMQVLTLAGTTTAGWLDGMGAAAAFNGPISITTDSVSGASYVADQSNNRIRMVTSAGVVTTLAGSGAKGAEDGPVSAATFNLPGGVTLDASGIVYVADSGNDRVRKVAQGAVSTVGSAMFMSTGGVAMTPKGSLIVTSYDHRIWNLDPVSGRATVLAGSGGMGGDDGPAMAATFELPFAVVVDKSETIYISDMSPKIRRLTAGGVVSTLAGTVNGFSDGPGSSALFGEPRGLAIDSAGALIVADAFNNRVRKVEITGAGQLVVSWQPPSQGSSVTYVATATAGDHPSGTCSTSGTTCTISGLASDVAYAVVVTATGSGGSASSQTSATPN